jgi:Cd2+/Zn2+-exporting ATPase
MEEAAVKVGDSDGGGRRKAGEWEKMYLDVLGICCTAEVALVDGVRAVTVVVPSRTVIVEHAAAASPSSTLVTKSPNHIALFQIEFLHE